MEVFPLVGIPEVRKGSDLARMILDAASTHSFAFKNRDIVVVKQKVVSKAEGRLVRLASVAPTRRALALAAKEGKDPKVVELILRESVRVVRTGHGVIITETRQGFVCANSGIDQSNVPKGYVALLPLSPDATAKRLRARLQASTRRRLAVVITDTFGRPWRNGQTDVAIGSSGIAPLVSYAGRRDRFGYRLKVTEPAVVDEVAGAAELAAGKLDQIPVAVVRGVRYDDGDDGVASLIMDPERDLFR
ncbi:MAG: coenzyme F420-0:L-glutamate ligase [Thaumarchaeota archaeon]|nr:coenzyme F420-0:L-glutamate ligase [Nitrososphaerota archaeon]